MPGLTILLDMSQLRLHFASRQAASSAEDALERRETAMLLRLDVVRMGVGKAHRV